ncbi:hypothetical protein ACVOMV_03500 [Mesorhizobium atlanticum]
MPSSPTFLQVRGLCSPEAGTGGCWPKDGLFEAGPEWRRTAGLDGRIAGALGGGGNTSDTTCLEAVVPGGALSQTRLTSIRLGTITVPSSLRVQAPAASSAEHRTKAVISIEH